MICGAFGKFYVFYVGVNYIPSLFVERHMALNNALLFTLVTAAVQIPGKILNGLLAELVGRKAIYAIFTVPAAIGAYEFGQTGDPFAMLAWASLFLFCAAGSAPSYEIGAREQYPTPIRATGQATVEAIGGRLIGGVIWTLLFPIVVAGWGIAATMTLLSLVSVTTCRDRYAIRTGNPWAQRRGFGGGGGRRRAWHRAGVPGSTPDCGGSSAHAAVQQCGRPPATRTMTGTQNARPASPQPVHPWPRPS